MQCCTVAVWSVAQVHGRMYLVGCGAGHVLALALLLQVVHKAPCTAAAVQCKLMLCRQGEVVILLDYSDLISLSLRHDSNDRHCLRL